MDRVRLALAKTLQQGAETLGVEISARQQQQLLDYLQLLYRWNRTYNLTAITDQSQAVSRHLLDSLAVVPHIEAQRLLDVGSGGGLPGVVIAIMRPDMALTLLDSNSKKCRFLVQVKGELGLQRLNVLHSRLEHYSPEPRHDAIISRAFASLATMVRLCAPCLTPNGQLLAMKGRLEESELNELTRLIPIEQTLSLTVPGLEQEQRHLLLLYPKGVTQWPK
ncbi:16S rRNA (guanine(527)-N(7))-methyltransferase RsmG [Ectothiorhodospiraceae bacterium BW-2]|nr:16S rRNA (guanine(527)-N(7))-methyltransferase RsmG [Ectothiorhodospiraceae bacterium BW-2]